MDNTDQIDLNQRVMDEQQQTVKQQSLICSKRNWREAINNCQVITIGASIPLKITEAAALAWRWRTANPNHLDIQEIVYGDDELSEFMAACLVQMAQSITELGQQAIDLWIEPVVVALPFIRTAICPG